MVNIVRFAEISELLAQVEQEADALMPNEREMFATLKDRYQEPVDGAFDDALCLQLMLRNLEVRKGLGADPRKGFRGPVELTPGRSDDS